NIPFRGSTKENDVWRSLLGIEQQLTTKLKLYFNWNKTELKSSDASVEYERNLYIFGAQMIF
ncbi:MAG: hypothetical protein OEY11_15710, partial [Gammaproteobacteria bacterium]|nr:hypothetical protein [Gammaproteobacteria bacterium]